MPNDDEADKDFTPLGGSGKTTAAGTDGGAMDVDAKTDGTTPPAEQRILDEDGSKPSGLPTHVKLVVGAGNGNWAFNAFANT